jgi:ABC-type transport system substrate-binding protein
MNDAQNAPGDDFVTTSAYARIGFEKYVRAFDRVASVHARFKRDLDVITAEIERQAEFAAVAVDRCREVAPLLARSGSLASSVSSSISDAGRAVREGRASLSAAISSVKESVASLNERNIEMRGVLRTSEEVGEGVHEIAEIAIENKVIAINASVTASKASDKVKGFKVIAGEVTRLSATMADQVTKVVERSTQVADRVRKATEDMEESIRTTQSALERIDEAFALLDRVESSIGGSERVSRSMAAANADLVAKERDLDGSLAAIGESVDRVRRISGEVLRSMDAQQAAIDGVRAELPSLASIAEEAAKLPCEGEGPKRLRAYEAPLTSYDPALSRMLREMNYIACVCVTLIRYSSEKKLVPYLADTWFLRSDGRTWEFTLRSDAVFSDGSPVRARDVKFSFERLMNPELRSPYAALFSVIEGADAFMEGRAREVTGIAAVDDVTVRFTLKASFNFFLGLLALRVASILKETPEIFSRPISKEELVSAGPFVPAPSGDGNVDVLLSNRRFLNGRPFIDRYEIRRDVADVPTAFADGSIDIACNLPTSAAQDFSRLGFNGRLSTYLSRYCYGLLVNFGRRSPFAAFPDARKALAMAMRKDHIVNAALSGDALKADVVLHPDVFDMEGRVPLPFDLDAARALLEPLRPRIDADRVVEIGFRRYPNIAGLDAVADSIVASLRDLGFSARCTFKPHTTPIVDFREDFDLVFLGFMPEIDLYSAVEPFINPAGGDNYFGYRNDELYELLEGSITIKNDQARRRYFRDVIEKLTTDVFMVPLFFKKVLLATGQDVRSVYLTAEESFFPDALYFAPRRPRAESSARVLDAYSGLVDKLASAAKRISIGAKSLISIGRDAGTLVEEQRGRLLEADSRFAEFSSTADAVADSRRRLVEETRATSREAARTGEAATLVSDGISGLLKALERTSAALQEVRNDVESMLSSVVGIQNSNSFISSIAINAAIVAAKNDVRGGDLTKVSASISDQAKRNAENTEAVRVTLARLGEEVEGHAAAVRDVVVTLSGAIEAIGRSGEVLANVAPLLRDSGERCGDIERASAELAHVLGEARSAVARMTEESRELEAGADTLQFGLDMEQSAADVLSDVGKVNLEVGRYLAQ